MEDQGPPERHEVELSQALLPLLHILDLELDEIVTALLEKPSRRPIERQRARVANATIILCRRLAEDLRRYEHLSWLEDEGLEDGLTEEDLDF